jgi:hypothetical protein
MKIEELRFVVQVEGGIVQEITANSPIPVKVYIVDYDIKNADFNELITTPEGDVFVGHLAETRCNDIYVDSIFKAFHAGSESKE